MANLEAHTKQMLEDYEPLKKAVIRLAQKNQCEDCGFTETQLHIKGDHHGGYKVVCRNRDECHKRGG